MSKHDKPVLNPAPGYCKHCKQYTIEEPLPAEPVQEPVAWIQPNHLQEARQAPFLCRVEPTKRRVDFVPLYTAPPQRKPLTDEKVCDLWSWSMTTEAERTATTQQHAFARAIERAHGIGDNT